MGRRLKYGSEGMRGGGHLIRDAIWQHFWWTATQLFSVMVLFLFQICSTKPPEGSLMFASVFRHISLLCKQNHPDVALPTLLRCKLPLWFLPQSLKALYPALAKRLQCLKNWTVTNAGCLRPELQPLAFVSHTFWCSYKKATKWTKGTRTLKLKGRNCQKYTEHLFLKKSWLSIFSYQQKLKVAAVRETKTIHFLSDCWTFRSEEFPGS